MLRHFPWIVSAFGMQLFRFCTLDAQHRFRCLSSHVYEFPTPPITLLLHPAKVGQKKRILKSSSFTQNNLLIVLSSIFSLLWDVFSGYFKRLISSFFNFEVRAKLQPCPTDRRNYGQSNISRDRFALRLKMSVYLLKNCLTTSDSYWTILKTDYKSWYLNKKNLCIY